MSPATLPPLPTALRGLDPHCVGAAARMALVGGTVHVRPELVVSADADTLTALGATPDAHRAGSLLLDDWRVWPAPEGIDAFLVQRRIPVDAIAVDPDGGVRDPLDGRADLEAGRVRVPDDAWGADPLTVLRAPALASALAVRLDRSDMEAIEEHAGGVLRGERTAMRATLTDLLVGRRPAGALQVLARTKVLHLVLPEAAAMIDFHKSSRHHHKDVWNHTRQVVRQAVPLPIIRWAALMHDIGKPYTRSYGERGQVHFFRHDELGAFMFEGVATRLQFPPAMAERIRVLVLHHLRAGLYHSGWSDAAIRRFANEMAPFLDDLFKLSRADVTSKRPGKRRRVLYTLRELRDRIEKVRAADAAARPVLPKGLGRLIIDDLGIAPGPRVGVLRRLCTAAVHDGRLPPDPDPETCLRFLRTVVERDAA